MFIYTKKSGLSFTGWWKNSLQLTKTIPNANCQGCGLFCRSVWIRSGMGGARASVHMRIRWETRLKTESYAARCRKRAGRVRLEQRPAHRRTHPGTTGPAGYWQALTASLSPGITSSWNRGGSSGASGRRIRSFPLSLSSLLLSAPQERPRDIGNVASKRLGFIPVRLPALTVNKTVQRQQATTAGFTMVLLAARSRRCLNSCCMGTLCLQLLLWILCAVNGEEQPFSVEVRTVICWHGSISIKEQDTDFPSH